MNTPDALRILPGPDVPELVPFSTSVPLHSNSRMTPFPAIITAPLVFHPAARRVDCGRCLCLLQADGVAEHIPAFPLFKPTKDSGVWLNWAGALNAIAFWHYLDTCTYTIIEPAHMRVQIPRADLKEHLDPERSAQIRKMH